MGAMAGGALGGMFGGGGGGPKAPDPYAMASAQMGMNKDAAFGSLINQSGPFGSVNYGKNPDGSFNATATLDPAAQRARDMAGDRLGMFSQNWGSGPNWSQKAEDAIYGRATSRLDPQFQQRERDLMTRLETQGITQGSDAHREAMANFGRERTDAYDNARNSSIMGGFDVADRQRGREFGEIGSLFGLSSANAPQAVGHAGIGSPDLMGAINNQYQGQLGAYSAKKQGQAQMLGSLLKLPLMFAGGG